MTKYINEPNYLRLKPEGYWAEPKMPVDRGDIDAMCRYNNKMQSYNKILASQPTFLKIGSGWERFKEGDTVDGGEVDFSYQIASNGWWADTSKEGYEQYIGDAYKRIVARLKHKEAGEESEDRYVLDWLKSIGRDPMHVSIEALSLLQKLKDHLFSTLKP
jgi:hypothetical protein